MKKKNKKKLKNIFIILSFLIIIIFSYLYNNKILNVKNILSDISIFNNEKSCKEDKRVEELNKEIKSLKNELEIGKLLTDSNKINASIVFRNNSYWNNNITINKGSKHNIKKGSAVLSNNTLIGYISNVNKNTSIVKLITANSENYISAKVNINGIDYYGIIKKYNIIKNELYLENVIGDINPNNEDVVTSGLTLNMPSGIYIGKVKDIIKDKYNLSNTLVITPGVNYNDINLVEVLSND